jgi:hypothetical protein
MGFRDDKVAAETALANGEKFVYEGKTYTPAQIVSELVGPNGLLTIRAAQEQQAVDAQAGMTKQEKNLQARQDKATKQALNVAKKNLKTQEQNKNLLLQDFRAGRIDEKEYNAYFANIDQLKNDIAAIEAGAPAQVVSGGNQLSYRLLTPRETGTLTGQRTDVRGRTGFANPPTLGPEVPETVQGQIAAAQTPLSARTDAAGRTGFGYGGAPTGGGGGVGGVGGKGGVTKADVDAALAKSGLPDTPENRKAIRADLKAGKEPVGDWLSVFKREFPQYTYLLDETVFGADVTALLQRSVTQKWYDSEQAATLMEQGFTGTEYYKNTTTSQQTFDKLTPANKQAQIDASKLSIQQTYGNLQFDDATLTTIATKAARDGKKGKALDLYIYQESFAKPVGATEFAQPTAATRALTSTAADEVRKVGRDYGVKVDDQTIQDVLVGKTTLDDLRQSYKIAARRWYKGAADDIDAGVTVAQLFQPYKQYAAAVLGKPMDQIDLIDVNGAPTIYSEALQGTDGPLSIGDWVKKLKSDDRYGWQFTDDAKQKANNLVMSLEKAFGYRA